MTDLVTLLIGTTKGAFLIAGAADRTEWSLRGPFGDLWTINHMIGDPDTGRIWAAGGNEWTGAGVWRSEDNGQTWALAKLADGQQDDWARNDPHMAELFDLNPGPPAPFTGDIDSVWSQCFAHGVLYA
ncbi:unnamed protein product, partial [Ectocarpus sp. 12 AP-2014]